MKQAARSVTAKDLQRVIEKVIRTWNKRDEKLANMFKEAQGAKGRAITPIKGYSPLLVSGPEPVFILEPLEDEMARYPRKKNSTASIYNGMVPQSSPLPFLGLSVHKPYTVRNWTAIARHRA